MTSTIVIPTALKDRALNEIQQTSQRTNPNLADDALRRHVLTMFAESWGNALRSYEMNVAPYAARLRERVQNMLDEHHFTGEGLDEAKQRMEKILADGLERTKPIHRQPLVVVLANSGMTEATAAEIVDACFFSTTLG